MGLDDLLDGFPLEWKGQSKSLRINGLLNSLQDEVSARVDIGEGGAVEDVDLEIGPGCVVEVSEYLSSRPRIDAADMTHPATAESEDSREDVGQVDAIAIPGPRQVERGTAAAGLQHVAVCADR